LGYPEGNGASGLAIADFNGDDKLDIVSTFKGDTYKSARRHRSLGRNSSVTV
jgi:hypothetical protein